MPRKVIIDCDPGIDDAVALCLALFDPRLDVLAVTATAGNVDAHQTSANVQAIIEHVDPPRWPRIGTATSVARSDAKSLHGEDGLGNAGLAVSQHHHQRPSEKVIFDTIRENPEEVTILAFGPLSNVSRAFVRDPDVARQVDRIIIVGGSVDGVGNITPVAEFNIFGDAEAARNVFRSPTTKTLVPLDMTTKISWDMDLISQLPDDGSRVGSLLQRIIPYSFRAHRQHLGLEGIYLHDVIGLMYGVSPELFETAEMAGDVETMGDITHGATVFDRRPRQGWRNNMEVITQIDQAAIRDSILRGLKFACQTSL